MDARYGVAIVTGASSGIGKATALELARKGCKVALIGRRMNELTLVADSINRNGGRAQAFCCDVSNRAEIFDVTEKVGDTLGPVDLVVANAGVSMQFPAARSECEKIETTYRVNLLGALYTIHASLPGMISRGFGHIVGMSSMASYSGVPMKGSYCGSKAALRIELEAMRPELRSKGIYVTTVCPGYIKTPMTSNNKQKMPFLLEVDDAAKRIVDAIYSRKRVYDFPWQMSMVMGLTSKLPVWLHDMVMARVAATINEK